MVRFRCLLLVVQVGLAVAACATTPKDGRPAGSGQSGAELPGLDASALTPREEREWREYIAELLAPCPDVAVSVAECVAEQRACASCVPAARYLMHLVRAGRPKSQVLDLFELRFDPSQVRTIVVGDSASRGPLDAPVTIVEFADFECPSCGLMAQVVDTVLALYDDEVRFVFKHYPISYHPHAHVAARAAVAAQKQGKFWPMHRICFERSHQLTEPDLERHAAELGLDMARFKQDMNAEHVHRQVDRERKQGEGLGLKGTPTLYINGREVPLRALDDPLRDLKEWIDVEIAMARGTGPQSVVPRPTRPPAVATGAAAGASDAGSGQAPSPAVDRADGAPPTAGSALTPAIPAPAPPGDPASEPQRSEP